VRQLIDDPYVITSDDPSFDAYCQLLDGNPEALIKLLGQPARLHPLLQRELGLMLEGKHPDYKFGKLGRAGRGRPKRVGAEKHKRDRKIAAFHASQDAEKQK
jgi:hypothetical protein